ERSMCHHNLPERLIALHELVRLANLLEREHAIDDGTNVAALEHRQDVAHERLSHRGFLASGPRAHHGASDHETSRQNRSEIEIRRASGEQPDQDDAAEWRRAFDARRPVWSADQIETC